MANVHRAYQIRDDEHWVRVEGSDIIFKFSGPNQVRDSYDKLRQLIAQEQKKDAKSRMIDHANPT